MESEKVSPLSKILQPTTIKAHLKLLHYEGEGGGGEGGEEGGGREERAASKV